MRVPALRSVFLDVSLCVLLAACLCGTAHAVVWSGTAGDQVISFDDNEYARAVQVWTPVLGQAHAVWGEDAPTVREVHYARSEDSGNTWTSTAGDRVISFPDGHGVNPEACAIAGTYQSASRMIVVWSEDVTDTREVHYGISTDDGATWSSETQDLVLSDPASAADTGAPSVVVESPSRIHVVWTQTSTAGSVEVFYSRSTDGGMTWSGTSADRMISFPDGNGAVSPQLVITNDALVVVWREVSAAGGSAIHVGISTNGGTTWSSETADREISQPATLITNLAASADPCLPAIHVVYTASFDTQAPFHYEVLATSSENNGLTFNGETENVPVSFDEGGGRSASNPDVYFGEAQNAIAVWDEEDEAGATNEIHVSYSGFGGPWSGATADEIISFPDGEDGYRPSVHGDQCVITAARGVPAAADRGFSKLAATRDIFADTYVLWTEFAGGTTDNYEVHYSGAAFLSGAVDDVVVTGSSLQVSPNPSSGPLDLRWRLSPGESAQALEIFDASGRLVWAAPSGPAADRGAADAQGGVRWDRRDLSGRQVPAGCYFARLRTAGGGSRTAPFVLL